MDDFIDNIDYSKSWIMKKLLETSFQEKKTGKTEIITMKKSDLFNLILKFINLNERGE